MENYFGKNIRYLRHEKEMSQEELATMLGYKSDVTVQHWESGRSEPPVKVVQKLCDIFDTDIETLYYHDMQKEFIDTTINNAMIKLIDANVKPKYGKPIHSFAPETIKVIEMMQNSNKDIRTTILNLVEQIVSLGQKGGADAKSEKTPIG